VPKLKSPNDSQMPVILNSENSRTSCVISELKQTNTTSPYAFIFRHIFKMAKSSY